MFLVMHESQRSRLLFAYGKYICLISVVENMGELPVAKATGFVRNTGVSDWLVWGRAIAFCRRHIDVVCTTDTKSVSSQ